MAAREIPKFDPSRAVTKWRRWLPLEIGRPLELLVRAQVVAARDAIRLGVFILLTVVFEGFGVATLLPILEFVESEGQLSSVVGGSRLWEVLVQIYVYLGIPIALPTLSAVAFSLILARQVMSYLSTVETAKLAQQTERMLAEKIFASVLGSKSQFLDNLGSGSFIDAIYQQCQTAAGAVRVYATAARLLLTISAYGILMFVSAPEASAIATLVVVVSVLSVSRYVHLTRYIMTERVAAQRLYTLFISERFRAWLLIKLSDTHDAEKSLFARHTRNLYDLAIQIARAGGKIQLIIVPAMTAFALFSLYVAVEFLDVGLTIITLFVVVLLRLIPVSEGISRARQGIANSVPAFERVARAIADADANYETSGGAIACRALKKCLSLHNVDFSYQTADRPALRGVNISIPAAKMTAIVGASGAGKSTLLDLIPSLLAPTSGHLEWDGVPIGEYSLSSLRRQIAVVSQSPIVFDDTVLKNVRYASPDASEEDVVAACRLAFADDFIRRLPGGYHSNIGEGGARLSGGQLQRLVLARALLENASVILLDEPTSALDYEAERKVQAAIDNLVAQAGITVVVIAHRLSTIRNANYFVALKEGRVVQSGSTDGAELNEDWYAQFGDQ